MGLLDDKPKENTPVVTLSESTVLRGTLRFAQTLCIRGKFYGTIESPGNLIIDKGALVEADHIYVKSITVHGFVAADIRAEDKVDLMTGAQVKGDIAAGRLRIADGVLFEGQCCMTNAGKEVEIFARGTDEIKAELQQLNAE
ncbi:hypothetical protein AGMMS50212_07430 [Spirochaetia bacterium]|nr:hypothetical protein AGMMS50212_07430 [Spirochaetia bacterium]